MPIFDTIQTGGVPVKVFAGELDPGARRQLIDLAESGIAEEFVAAMPDVHFGLGATIGTVFASTWAVCPNAVGVDIGCGMAAVPFPGLTAEALGQGRRWDLHRAIKEKIPTGMTVHRERQWAPVFDDQARTPWLSMQLNDRAYQTLGTLGGGNHFIEIVHDPSGQVWAMLHSGSRNLGKLTAERYNALAKTAMENQQILPRNRDLNYLELNTEEGQDYLLDMNWCQKFALANRQSMLERIAALVAEQTGAEAQWDGMVNIHHNFCSQEVCRYQTSAGGWVEKTFWITRKGATSARQWEKGLIPGSMAVGSWLVEGLGNWESWYSCSHGAGRTKSRTASFAEISQESFESAMTGIVAETVPELRDEAPQAYKNLDTVMRCQSDLVRPVLRLNPLINVKGWDKAGGNPWAVDKVPVTLVIPAELGLVVTHIETQSLDTAGKLARQWTPLKDFRLKPAGNQTARELWVQSELQPNKRLLLVGTITESTETRMTITVREVKKKEKL
jgi:tRNA-splicing ligase RtcB